MTGRIVSVDVMRGLTMAAMIVVNNPGSWAHMAPGLRHADWGAWPRLADFVFPGFLVLVGVATTLALSRHRGNGASNRALLARSLRRALVLGSIGLFLNLFPDFDLQTVRIPGVLQRIAVVSLACAAGYLWLPPRVLMAAMVVLLGSYTYLLLTVPVPGYGVALITPEAHLPAWLDDRILGPHTWRGPGDPEGLLSSLGAVATGWMGVMAGHALTTGRPARKLALGGLAAVLGGIAATGIVPMSKEIWSAPYALFTGGVVLLALAGLVRADPGLSAPIRALVLLGRHALTAFILAHLLSDMCIRVMRWRVESGDVSLHSMLYHKLLASWLPESVASAAASIVTLVTVWFVVRWADDRGYRLQI